MDAPAELLRDFVNTYDVQGDTDELASPAELAIWLREHGLISESDRAVDDDWALAVNLREGLRTALRHEHSSPETPPPVPAPADPVDPADLTAPAGLAPAPPDPALAPAPEAASARLEAALAALPLRITLVDGAPVPEPLADGAARGLGLIATAVLRAHADGSWPRLKVCADSTCQWAFIDSSKNRSRSWCSMRVCGNRTKTRAYRARRQRTTPGSS
ncbi:zf-CGNR multi-domain protein [Sphaerisporangium album]|uniref:Zf-CGNR multi-domain protein n=1 Tax=Sphaerisporangium album TaxID=509200 RepID=A0A367FS49_9ACTN|nr:CGNR zinc finger domain-containing protein [Sphaerisporangium album]RCG32520.1 zf-CGNR multi-domain protein [Sphaerisporangium album]